MDGWDDDDSHFEGVQPIIILDDDRAVKKGAELKFEFVGTDSSEFNTDNIIDEDIGGGALRIQWDTTKVVHGKLKPDGPPATLIVFQFVFLPHGSNNRFKNTTITVTFSAGKVLKISPDNQWTTLPSERQQERSHTISPGIEAALGPAKATTSYTWQQKETETIKGHAKVTGEITGRPYKLGSTKRKKDMVVWTLSEDSHAKTGLPSLLETALLLQRKPTEEQPLDEEFTASIKILGDVNRSAAFEHKLRNIGKLMSGGTREGKDIVFRPPAVNRGTAQNREKLEDEDLEAYRHLISVREWENPGEEGGPSPSDKSANAPPQVQPLTPASVPTAVPTFTTAQNSIQVSKMAETDKTAASLAKLTLPDTPITPTAQGVPLQNHVRETTEIVNVESEKLPILREQLRLVRAEANWVVRVIDLLAEERRLLDRIGQLEFQGGATNEAES
ncbi:hypothetical protein CGCF245_v014878 [Colletotrichum fructicola]|nr:hypothetical protein CGCF245_v014878 [Colletotrichum fructicola]